MNEERLGHTFYSRLGLATFAATIASICTFPVDVVRKRLQLRGIQSGENL
jgi:hypothetical protein